MHGVVGAVVAMVGAEVDPTVQPVRQSFWVFLFVAVLLVLLIFSMLRHMRRARTNLAPERPEASLPSDETAAARGTATSAATPDPAARPDPAASSEVEGVPSPADGGPRADDRPAGDSA